MRTVAALILLLAASPLAAQISTCGRSRNPVGFCRVCRRAIERVIDLYSRK